MRPANSDGRPLKVVDVVIHGIGHVGRALVTLLCDTDRLAHHGLKVRVVGAVDSRGGIWNPEGIPPVALLDAKQSAGTLAAMNGGEYGLTAIDCLDRSATPPLLLESTLVDLETGGPGLRTIRAFLERGADVVTANKGPLVVAFPELDALVRAGGGSLHYSGTLGLPILSLRDHLSHVRIERMEGIVNGTTNFILTAMAQGIPYDQALRQVQEAGLAEADATLDISGADAANKLLILSHIFLKQQATRSDLEVRGITGITHRDLAEADARGEVIKLIASAERNRDGTYRLRVGPRSIAKSHPLASLHHSTIGLWLKTDINGELMVSLTQAEPTPTAGAMLHDLLQVIRDRREPAALMASAPAREARASG